MTADKFVYAVPRVKDDEFPMIPKVDAARVACIARAGGEVRIVGNSAGLQYLAQHLVAMSLISRARGFHVHLDPEEGQLDEESCLITIHNLDFDTDAG